MEVGEIGQVNMGTLKGVMKGWSLVVIIAGGCYAVGEYKGKNQVGIDQLGEKIDAQTKRVDAQTKRFDEFVLSSGSANSAMNTAIIQNTTSLQDLREELRRNPR